MSPNHKPVLTTLSYSAGTQSQCLLEMVLRGDIEKPNPFLVLNVDPGMKPKALKSITVIGYRWRDKVNGNTYHRSKILLDGKTVTVTEFQ